jgi:hypothetical protein
LETSVSVRAQDTDRLLRAGVCAKTGVPANAVIEMRVVHTPPWIWILVFFGILPLVIAYAFTKKEVTVELPATEEVGRRRSGIARTMLAVTVTSVLLIATAAITTMPGLAWLGAAGVVGVVMALPYSARAWISATYDGEWVHLSRLHPNYVQALDL